jgi:uncharacterized protein (TIGR02265 family)
VSSSLGWVDPPWSQPLDGDAAVRAVPADATMTGLFLDAVAGIAREQRIALKSARPRYVQFQPYPLREHCELLVEAARALFSDVPLRQGLRKLGRGAPHALVRSTIGRVVFASAEGPLDIIRAMAKSYSMHMRPSSLEVEAEGPRAAVVRVHDVHNFLDSHNIGVFEGVLKYAGVKGTVKIRPYTRTSADLLCVWESP